MYQSFYMAILNFLQHRYIITSGCKIDDTSRCKNLNIAQSYPGAWENLELWVPGDTRRIQSSKLPWVCMKKEKNRIILID